MTIDERITAELQRHVPHVDEREAWERIQSRVPARRRHSAFRLVAVPVSAVGLLLVGSVLVSTLSSAPAPVSGPESPLLGTWVTTDSDGSNPTATVETSADGVVEIVVVDGLSSVCSGAPSTMTGNGRFEGENEMVFPSPVLTCDDGSPPEALGGPPLEEQFRNFTFTRDPATDTLTDSLGTVWVREIADDTGPEPPISDTMWPQSSLEEVREAQELADAGDPDVSWQLEPDLEENVTWGDFPEKETPEIFARFLREELGWEDYAVRGGVGYGLLESGQETITLTYVRCVPGKDDPLYPDDPRPGGCVPTMDDLRYETVEITVAQPAVQGPSGIWVVIQSEMVEPIEQVVPPTEAEASTMVEAFLRARIDGEGAEQYFGGSDGTAPLLYATSNDAPYERYEFDLVPGLNWPDGGMRFEVRLYAEGGQTVVEQSITVVRDDSGRIGLEVGAESYENGQASTRHVLLGGEVTFDSEGPWESWLIGDGSNFVTNGEPADAKLILRPEGRLYVLADPLPVDGCQEGPAAADAESLAQSILSNDEFEATAPVPTTIGGARALRMDLLMTTTESRVCSQPPRTYLTSDWFPPGSRMRLYLVDLPSGGSAQTLSIAISAPDSSFERVVEAAAPILDSFEFHTD